MKSLYNISTILLIFLIFASCSSSSKNLPQEKIIEEDIATKDFEENIEIAKQYKAVSFVFVGDIMTHPLLVERVEAEYKLLMHYSNYLEGKDITFANLEFSVNTNRPPLPYPSFNGSYNYLKYFSEHFNLFSVANNHAYDQGPQAQTEVMGFLSDFGVTAIGGSTNERNIPPVITNINGIDIFLAAYSSLDNGLAKMNQRRGDYVYYMNFYPDYKEMLTKVRADLENVPSDTLKIVSLHYGMEYITNATRADIKLMRDMVESGVDVVVAHHPHVIRPVEYYEGTNHSGTIIHSLGNFLANHASKYDYLDIGATVMLNVTEDSEKNKTYDFDYLATYNYYYYNTNGVRDVRIIPIRRDPSVYGYPFATVYNYHQTNLNRMLDGYKLVDRFFSPLTNFK